MSNSTTNLDLIVQAQSAKEATANALIDACSPASFFGRHQSTTSGLTWGYYGGNIEIDGVLTQINNGTITLTASATNYIERSRTGVVSKNTTGWTAGLNKLYVAVCGTSSISSYQDCRGCEHTTGLLNLVAPDSNATLTADQANCNILQFTGTLTAQRNIVLPLDPQQWTVFNNTTGGFGLQFIGATGTGITVAAGMRAIVYSDGTNVVRATADV